MSLYLFELDAIKPVIIRTIAQVVQDRLGVRLNNTFGKLPECNKITEALLQRYLCVRSDEIERDAISTIDEITVLADSGHYDSKDMLPGCSVESSIEHTDKILSILRDPEVSALYSVIIKSVTGGSDNIAELLYQLLHKVLPKNTKLDKSDYYELSSHIVEAVIINEDDLWINNFAGNIKTTDWRVVDVEVIGDDIYVSVFEDYRVLVWQLHKALRKLRYAKKEAIQLDVVAEIDYRKDLSEEARRYFRMQLISNTIAGLPLRFSNYQNPSQFLDIIPMQIRQEISSFVKRRYYL